MGEGTNSKDQRVQVKARGVMIARGYLQKVEGALSVNQLKGRASFPSLGETLEFSSGMPGLTHCVFGWKFWSLGVYAWKYLIC